MPREKPQPPKRKSPELPRPTIPRRAASYSNFTELRDDEFSILEARNVPPSLYKLESPAIVEVPLRPKSRNDIISDVECARGIPAKHPRNFTKELDLMRWYGEMEDDLRDAGDDEYKFVVCFTPVLAFLTIGLGCFSLQSSHNCGLAGIFLTLLMIHYSIYHG